ncbi:xanthine dehydrogenase [Kyrpidia spormannii]|uniref:Xanthine dehydrogenase n=1 Tax=Kyrpidia spormannii TaxID=2055160 RepID=A0A2K8NAC4_9BACL|nr:XdhC/CoxI family protein [Kyrpidia spormannii]ATY85757.1 xanthine dehydrogenase [Kyrpidia spormannii]
MRDLEDIFEAGLAESEAGRPVAMALVAGVEGSAYRHAGARMLVRSGGAAEGAVSGGCLENELVRAGAGVAATGEAQLMTYDMRTDEDAFWGSGSGCAGLVRVLVHRPEPEILRGVLDELRAGRTVCLATVVDPGKSGIPAGSQAFGTPSGGGEEGPMGEKAAGYPALADLWNVLPWPEDGRRAVYGRVETPSGDMAVLVERLTPAPVILILGAGHDAPAMADLARTAGFRVLVADHRPGYAAASRFPSADHVFAVAPEKAPDSLFTPNTYVVVMTHQLEWDARWLKRLLVADVPYIGLLGPRDRARRLLAQFSDWTGSPLPPAEKWEHRLYNPVGLDLGGEGPGPVALSAVAQIAAVANGRDPQHLSARWGALQVGAP